MNRNGQIQAVIEEIVRRLITQYSPQKIFLFGSYAYGEPDEDSDIDLLAIKDFFIQEVLEKGKVLYG